MDGALVQGLGGVEDANAGRGSYQVKGLCLSLKQFFALLIKRLHHTTRSYKDFCAQVAFGFFAKFPLFFPLCSVLVLFLSK